MRRNFPRRRYRRRSARCSSARCVRPGSISALRWPGTEARVLTRRDRTGAESMILRRLSWAALAALLSLSVVAAARAQDFSSRPITVVVGLAPGGITDVTARLYAEAVSKNIGQRIVVENRQ